MCVCVCVCVSISSNHKCCIEGGLINFNYKRNLAFRIILAFFPSLVANVLRHNHLVEPGVEGRKVTPQPKWMFCGRYEEPRQIDCKRGKEWTNVHLGCEHA